MQTLTIAALDDDQSFLDATSSHIADYMERTHTPYALASYCKAEEFWRDFDAAPFDVAFLDIILPGANGIELARKIHARHPGTLIVFFTVSKDFAPFGYGVNAVDYVLKPAGAERIGEALAKCLAELRGGLAGFVSVRIGKESRLLKADSILYVASNNRHVHMHCDDGTVAYFGKLSETLPSLPETFIQIHKSYAVNLKRVFGMKNCRMFLDDGTALPISRPFRKSSADAFYRLVSDQV